MYKRLDELEILFYRVQATTNSVRQELNLGNNIGASLPLLDNHDLNDPLASHADVLQFHPEPISEESSDYTETVSGEKTENSSKPLKDATSVNAAPTQVAVVARKSLNAHEANAGPGSNDRIHPTQKSTRKRKKPTPKRAPIHRRVDPETNDSTASPKNKKVVILDQRFQFSCSKILIKHSCGRPRNSLNKILIEANKDLGLFAYFGQSSFCTKGDKISQIVLSAKLNEIIETQDDPLVMYVGLGPRKKKVVQQLAGWAGEPIPFFWDPKSSTTCIHYVGHFLPVQAETQWFGDRSPFEFKGLKRQARLTFSFHHFDSNIHDTIRQGGEDCVFSQARQHLMDDFLVG